MKTAIMKINNNCFWTIFNIFWNCGLSNKYLKEFFSSYSLLNLSVSLFIFSNSNLIVLSFILSVNLSYSFFVLKTGCLVVFALNFISFSSRKICALYSAEFSSSSFFEEFFEDKSIIISFFSLLRRIIGIFLGFFSSMFVLLPDDIDMFSSINLCCFIDYNILFLFF